MRVLFPTDFSAASRHALPYAIELCKRSGGRLRVITAYDLPYGERGISMTSLLEAMKENAEDQMREFEAEIKSAGVTYETDVLMGNPIRVIKEASGSEDIIVMGTKGSSGLEEILIGSNAASVIEGSNCPVLIVPPDHAFRMPKRILFCSELRMLEDSKSLENLANFARLFKAHVDILHVQNENGRLAGSREHIESALGDLAHNYTIVKADDMEEEVLAHAESTGADVIASMTKRYGFFEKLFHTSLTKQLAYHSKTPILALHKQ